MSYREQQIAQQGVQLASLVPEGLPTKADIDAAIVTALGEQSKVTERAKQEARAELGAKVPGPLSPASGSGESGIQRQLSDPDRRRAIARLPPSERAAIREQLLQSAENATGWRRGVPIP